MGVDFAQGFLLGRPAPADRLTIPAGTLALDR
jgi:EAL domain-containing protein (putative c-di-GMP-specific phosphodiesterase class I)